MTLEEQAYRHGLEDGRRLAEELFKNENVGKTAVGYKALKSVAGKSGDGQIQKSVKEERYPRR